MIGDGHRHPAPGVVGAVRHDRPADREDVRRRPDPSHHRLVPDAERHHVVAREVAVLAPMDRRGRIGKIAAGGDPGVELDQLADRAGADHGRDGLVEGQSVGRRNDLRDAFRVAARSRQHGARLGPIQRHARLAEHVLATLQRGDRDRRVHVRPGADADRVDLIVLDHRHPVCGNPRDGEFVRHALRGSGRPVGHHLDRDARLRQQPRYVPKPRVAAGADHADPNSIFRHGCFLPGCPGAAPAALDYQLTAGTKTAKARRSRGGRVIQSALRLPHDQLAIRPTFEDGQCCARSLVPNTRRPPADAGSTIGFCKAA